MKKEEIAEIQGHWLDGIFRKIRNIGGIEIAVIVLSTAEIMAMTFYNALKQSTKSKTLQAICDQILIDECLHLQFQYYSLDMIFQRKNQFVISLYRQFQGILLISTAIIVWLQYRKIYRAGGYTFRHFIQETAKEFRKLTGNMKWANHNTIKAARISQ